EKEPPMLAAILRRLCRKPAVRKPRKPGRLHVEALEARDVPALIGPDIIPPPPDYAGGDFAHARPVTLPAMQTQSVMDYLPSSSDVDVFRVHLRKGHFLVSDVDPRAGSPTLYATMKVYNSGGAQVANAPPLSTDPDNGGVS